MTRRKATKGRPRPKRRRGAAAAPALPPVADVPGAPTSKADRSHKPTQQTRALVASMAGLGHPQVAIAKQLGLGSKVTLAKHYRVELDAGMIQANNEVLSAFFEVAKDKGHRGFVPTAIFWLKNRLGWHDRQALEHTGKDGSALPAIPMMPGSSDNVVFVLPDNGRDPHLNKRRVPDQANGKEHPSKPARRRT